jgi:predicted PurR-regulated permease PerM
MAALFNFVPYLGPIAAFFILAVAALLTFDTTGEALVVPGVFLCLHLIEGQIVQPLTVGRRLEVNALVVLLAVWFGYGFWGIPGMVLAMPAVVALKVASQYQPNWGTVRDFLAPNTAWRPKALWRERVPKDPGAGVPAQGLDSVANRGS